MSWFSFFRSRIVTGVGGRRRKLPLNFRKFVVVVVDEVVILVIGLEPVESVEEVAVVVCLRSVKSCVGVEFPPVLLPLLDVRFILSLQVLPVSNNVSN